MVVSADYIFENQPSLADNFLNTINSITKKFTIAKNKITEEQINKYLFSCIQRVHLLNANTETVRDFIECYYINDVSQDEEILGKYTDILLNLSEDIDETIEEIENFNINNEVKNRLLNSFEELATTVVNTNFIISQKIAKAYIDNQSNTTILKDA